MLKKYVIWYWRAVKPVIWSVAVQVMLQIVRVCCSMGFIVAGKQLVDIATGKADGELMPYVVLLVSCQLIQILLNASRSHLQNRADVRMKVNLREQMFSHLLLTRNDIGGRRHSADMVSRLQEDVRLVSESMCRSLPSTIGAGLHFIAAFIFLMMYEPRLAWFVALLTPVGILASKYIMRRSKELTHDIRNSETDIQTHLQESIQHIVTIKTMDYSGESRSSLDGYQNDLTRNTMRKSWFSISANAITGLVFALGYLSAFLWGIDGLRTGAVTYGLMTAFLQLVGQIQRPIMELSHQLPVLSRSVASSDRLMEIEALPQEMLSGNACLLDGPVGIRIDDISFAYGEKKIYDGFSYDFKPGGVIAVTGATGIGKSTLIKLILSLLSPDKGRIEFYNEDVSVEACPDTRCNLAYVPQGNSLLSGSIRYNLLIGNPEASEKMLKDALHAASADFVMELPGGLDTDCFERGEGLSEGQAQRIAVARALLRPGRILLLDEFSSALDAATEEKLMSRLSERAKKEGLTIIMITHRTGILRYCTQTLHIQ